MASHGYQDMTNPQIIRALRLMNMEKNGAPTVAEFEALLTDQGRLDAFIELLKRPGALGQIKGYPNLMDALAGTDAGMMLALSSASAMAQAAKRQAAALAFINSQSALDTIFANPAVAAAFIASTALATANVPKMTSNTTPSGVASASSEYGPAYQAWRAFDQTVDHWAASAVANSWVQYKFDNPVFIHSVFVQTHETPYAAKNCRIEYSDDGVSFSVAKSIELAPDSQTNISINKSGFYKYWRLYVIDTTGGSTLTLRKLNFTGFVQP